MALPAVKAFLPGAAGGHRAPAPLPAAKPKPQKTRVPAAAKHLEKHGGKPHGKPPQHAPSHPHPSAPKSLQEQGPGELKHTITKQVQQATKTELEPFQRRGRELGSEEQGTVSRYNALGAANQQLIGGIQEKAEAGAKTFNNQVAEQAKTALSQNESTGQALAERGGGSTDPMLRAQEAAQRRQIEGTGQAAQVAAGQTGQAENSYLANLRAAAVQRMSEGAQGIQTGFAKRKAENQAKESELLGRQPERITKTLNDVTQRQFNNRATEAGLKVKLTGIQAKAQEGAASRAQKERASERGAGSAAARVGATEASTAERKWAKEADLQWKNLHPSGKSSNAPKAPSPAEGRKYMSNVAKAQSIAMQQGVRTGTGTKRLDQVRHYLQGLGYNADQVSAAMNLAYYGVLGPNDRKTAESYGLTSNLRPAWFKPHK